MTDNKTVFIYEGKNQKGETIKGETTGSSLTLVKASLRQQGITPKKVRKKPKPLFGSTGGKKIKTIDICVFARQMATMMTAGIPLVQSFDIVGKGHSNPSMQGLVMAVKADVESGMTFAESLTRHPKYFNPLFCNLVAAGEQSGSLETMLDRVATYQEKMESIRAKIKKALTYPIAVVCVAIGVTTLLLIKVVPQFESLFKGFGAELPAPTQFVVAASEFAQKWWWLVFGGISGVIAGIKMAKQKSKAFAFGMDRFLLKLPVFGNILNNAAIARFTRTLSITFSAGLPLVEALSAVSGATGNLLYTKAAQDIRENVSTGQTLQLALTESGLFPNMVVQMVAIGEESGALDGMLGKVATYYEEQVDNAVDNLSSLMEPIILVFLAVIVGGLVISMYLPIFKLGSVV